MGALRRAKGPTRARGNATTATGRQNKAKRSATKRNKSLYIDGAGPMWARNPDLAPNVLRDLQARGLWQRRELMANELAHPLGALLLQGLGRDGLAHHRLDPTARRGVDREPSRVGARRLGLVPDPPHGAVARRIAEER